MDPGRAAPHPSGGMRWCQSTLASTGASSPFGLRAAASARPCPRARARKHTRSGACAYIEMLGPATPILPTTISADEGRPRAVQRVMEATYSGSRMAGEQLMRFSRYGEDNCTGAVLHAKCNFAKSGYEALAS
jgi:hypothetical protein